MRQPWAVLVTAGVLVGCATVQASPPNPFDRLSDADRNLARTTREKALETSPSGTAVGWSGSSRDRRHDRRAGDPAASRRQLLPPLTGDGPRRHGERQLRGGVLPEGQRRLDAGDRRQRRRRDRAALSDAGGRSGCRQFEPHPEPAVRRVLEPDAAAINFGEIADNGEPETTARHRLIQAPAALEHLLPPLGRQARPVVVDQDRDPPAAALAR